MVKYLTLLFFLIFYGCEINGEQIIKPQKLIFDDLKFDVVSKNLTNDYFNNSKNHQKIGKIINYWFNNKIKSNGFNGALEVFVTKIELKETKKEDYFKFSINLELKLIESSDKLNINKTYEVSSREYGEITGNFSIKEQEILSLNLMYKSIDSISTKLLELI